MNDPGLLLLLGCGAVVAFFAGAAIALLYSLDREDEAVDAAYRQGWKDRETVKGPCSHVRTVERHYDHERTGL